MEEWGKEVSCQHCGLVAPPALGPGSGPHIAQVKCAGCGRFVQWLKKAVAEASAQKNHDLVVRMALTSMAADPEYPLTPAQRHWIAKLPTRVTRFSRKELEKLKEPLLTYVHRRMPTCEDIIWKQFDEDSAS